MAKTHLTFSVLDVPVMQELLGICRDLLNATSETEQNHHRARLGYLLEGWSRPEPEPEPSGVDA